MRRTGSIALYVAGGFLLICEVVAAFGCTTAVLKGEAAFRLLVVAGMALLASLSLAMAAYLSRGERARELGLTLLLASGAATFLIFSAGYSARIADDRPFSASEIGEAIENYWFGIAHLLFFAVAGWLMRAR
jgi:hypothetical protein